MEKRKRINTNFYTMIFLVFFYVKIASLALSVYFYPKKNISFPANKVFYLDLFYFMLFNYQLTLFSRSFINYNIYLLIGSIYVSILGLITLLFRQISALFFRKTIKKSLFGISCLSVSAIEFTYLIFLYYKHNDKLKYINFRRIGIELRKKDLEVNERRLCVAIELFGVLTVFLSIFLLIEEGYRKNWTILVIALRSFLYVLWNLYLKRKAIFGKVVLTFNLIIIFQSIMNFIWLALFPLEVDIFIIVCAIFIFDISVSGLLMVFGLFDFIEFGVN